MRLALLSTELSWPPELSWNPGVWKKQTLQQMKGLQVKLCSSWTELGPTVSGSSIGMIVRVFRVVFCCAFSLSDWCSLSAHPCRLTFTWWGCYGLCLWHKPTKLAQSFLFLFLFLFCSCVCFCLYGPFNYISFQKFSRQLSAFLLCSSGPTSSALLVLSTVCLFMKFSFSPDIIRSGWLGSKHQITN